MYELYNPHYYRSKSGVEAIDIIEEFDLNFNLGNAVKYLIRSGKKESKVKDLKKAVWYLEREINNSLEDMGLQDVEGINHRCGE